MNGHNYTQNDVFDSIVLCVGIKIFLGLLPNGAFLCDWGRHSWYQEYILKFLILYEIKGEIYG